MGREERRARREDERRALGYTSFQIAITLVLNGMDPETAFQHAREFGATHGWRPLTESSELEALAWVATL